MQSTKIDKYRLDLNIVDSDSLYYILKINNQELKFNLTTLKNQLKEEYGLGIDEKIPAEELTIKKENSFLKAKIVLSDFDFQIDSDSTKLHFLAGDLLLKLK